MLLPRRRRRRLHDSKAVVRVRVMRLFGRRVSAVLSVVVILLSLYFDIRFSNQDMSNLLGFGDAGAVQVLSQGWVWWMLVAASLMVVVIVCCFVGLIIYAIRRVDWVDPWSVVRFVAVYALIANFSPVFVYRLADFLRVTLNDNAILIVLPVYMFVFAMFRLLALLYPIVLVLLAGWVGGLLVERSAKKAEVGRRSDGDDSKAVVRVRGLSDGC